jgi:putative heme-binding domain-containing protein
MRRGVFGGRWVAGAAIWLAVAAGAGRAQDHAEHDPADIAYGLDVYLAQCASCHGETGDGVAGVDLRSGPLRRAATERDLIGVIRTGIPGTGMLAFDLDTAEMTGIVAYLRNMNYEVDAVTLGDAARGRTIFEGGGACLDCHRVRDRGPRVGPDLTAIGASRPASALRRSLLDPTGTMRPIDRPVELVTADGARVTGRRLNEDTYTVQIIDDAGRLRSFDKTELQRFDLAAESPMPAFGDRLSPEELADLLAYLVSLKG